MNKRMITVIALLLSFFTTFPAFAQFNAIEGLGFSLGDDTGTVKAALKTAAEPEPMESLSSILPKQMRDPNEGKTKLHLRTKGIIVFFNNKGKAETIRLESPFPHPVAGIKVGDDLKKVTSTLGKPIKTPWKSFISMEAYRYALDDSAYVTFHIESNSVNYIFISK